MISEPKFLDMMKMGYVILYQSTDKFIHKIIQDHQLKTFPIEHACWVHSEISGGGQWSVDVGMPKTTTTNILKKNKGRYIKILRYKNGDYQSRTRYKIAFWSASTCNIRYDFWGIAAFKLPILYKLPFIRKRIKTLLFCSDNVLWAFRKEHRMIMSEVQNTNKCLPAHFSASEEFEKVWEGRIP